MEQAERTLVVLFALLRGAQGVQLLVLLRVPLDAGTHPVVVAGVAAALTLETAAVVGRALVRGQYGARRTAWFEILFMCAAFVAIYAATPTARQVEASSWLFSPAIAFVCGTTLALTLRPALAGAFMIDACYSWGSVYAPSETSPLIFNSGAITAFPVLVVISLAGIKFARMTARRLRTSEQRLAEAAALKARFDERTRQGRFLHDSVIQVLEEVDRQIGSAGTHRGLIHEVRAASRQCRLYLDGKDPLGTDSITVLLHELDDHALTLNMRLRVVDERQNLDDPPYDSGVLSALNLCMREVLRNIRQHTSERTVTLRLQGVPNALCLVLTRNGAGYDPKLLAYGKFKDLELAGGTWEVDSRVHPHYGERVLFKITRDKDGTDGVKEHPSGDSG